MTYKEMLDVIEKAVIELDRVVDGGFVSDVGVQEVTAVSRDLGNLLQTARGTGVELDTTANVVRRRTVVRRASAPQASTKGDAQ